MWENWHGFNVAVLVWEDMEKKMKIIWAMLWGGVLINSKIIKKKWKYRKLKVKNLFGVFSKNSGRNMMGWLKRRQITESCKAVILRLLVRN